MTDKKHTFQLDDSFKLKYLQDAQLSPDGTMVVYAESHVVINEDAEKESEREVQKATLWLVYLADGEERWLTNGRHADTSPRWSPDGKQIAFISDRCGSPQIFLMPMDGGESRALTSMKQGVGSPPEWSPDGSHIAFTAGPGSEPRDPAAPYRVTRHVYRFDGMGLIDDALQNVFVILADGREGRQLTDDDRFSTALRWSPDGQEILFTSAMPPESHDLTVSLHCVNLEAQVREIVPSWDAIRSPEWTPDGGRIVFIGSPPCSPVGSKQDLWVVGAQGGEPECRTIQHETGVAGELIIDMPTLLDRFADPAIVISADGERAITQVQVGGTTQLWEFALRGPEAHRAIVAGERSCVLLNSTSGHLLFAVSDLNNPADLFMTDRNGKGEARLTRLNEELLGELEPPSVEHLVFLGSDGVEVEGWFLKPPGGEAPYPTILYIHGGPHAGFGHVYCDDFQMLAGAGYGVLIVNQRGSTGYGDAFSTIIVGDWGNLDYTDLMAGVDHAIEQGLADPNRLGCCGLSGGGNLSCWIVGQTDRFRAAVPENPVTNWVSMYGVSDIGPSFGAKEMGGLPHEIPDVYRRSSPITYAHRCTTPTLLIQAENDNRCPPEQSEQFYAVLKANGCVVEMLRLPGVSHVGSVVGPPIIRRAQNEALLDWMNRHVLEE